MNRIFQLALALAIALMISGRANWPAAIAALTSMLAEPAVRGNASIRVG